MAATQSSTVLQQLRTLFSAGTATWLDDGQLLEQFVDRRDETAFAALVARHGPLVLGACRRLLADPADVGDAFQATFLVLVQKAGSLRNRRLLGTWLYKVAYRIALRTRANTDTPTPPAAERVAADPADDLGRRELCAVIDEEILRLPWRYRRPVVLCYLEGLNHEEAARRLGCPLGTVNSRLAAARERLRVGLSRRGLAPSAVLVGTPSPAGSARAAVPPGLLRVTLTAAQRVADGSPVAGAASATVSVLSEGVLRAMLTSKIRIAAAVILGAGVAVAGMGLLPQKAPGAAPRGATRDQQTKSNATTAPSTHSGPKNQSHPAVDSDQAARDDHTGVPVNGTVRMPDGSPAAGATVEVMTAAEEPTILVRTNDSGQFQLHGVFALGCRLLAISADGTHQARLVVSSAAARTAFASPVEMSLAPAQTHEVTVLSDGRPVEGAHVIAGGQSSRVRGVTDRHGKANLWFPASEGVGWLFAWHRDLGVGIAWGWGNRPFPNTTRLELLPPGALTVRVIDLDGKAIGGLDLDVSVRTEDRERCWTRLTTMSAK